MTIAAMVNDFTLELGTQVLSEEASQKLFLSIEQQTPQTCYAHLQTPAYSLFKNPPFSVNA